MKRTIYSFDFLTYIYSPGSIKQWLLSSIPLWTMLVYSGYADPAYGYHFGSASFLMYFPIGALLVLFSLILNWVKGFLVLHFGLVSCGLIESGRILAHLHTFMVLLEALATLGLFLLRNTYPYPMLEQIQLFGHELLYAILLGGFLRIRGEASIKRSVLVGLGCFLVSSVWLLLSFIMS